MKYWIKLIIWSVISTSILVFSGDFIISKYYFKNLKISGEAVYRIQHPYYHHTLAKNFDGYGRWGGFDLYRQCTNGLGFKVKCENIKEDGHSFDFAFIGDSFTEALGIPYEDSFVGMFARENSNYEVANLAVSSYSPIIYLKKVEYLLQKGVNFNHLITFVDISDIRDEALYYFENKDGAIESNYYRATSTIIGRKNMIEVKNFVKQNFRILSIAFKLIRENKLFGSPDVEAKVRMNYFEKAARKGRWKFDLECSENYCKDYSEKDLSVQGGIDKAIIYMQKLHKLLENRGIKLSVGVYPWPNQLQEMSLSNEQNLHSRIWEKFCENRCEFFIDVFPKFNELVNKMGAKKTYNYYYLQRDIHFNEAGNKLVYEAIKDIVISN